MVLRCCLTLLFSDLYFPSQTHLCVNSQQGSPSYSCSYSYIFRWELLSMSTLSYWLLCRTNGPKSKECSHHSALAAQWVSNSGSGLMNLHSLLFLFGVIKCYKILYYCCSHFLSNKLFYVLQQCFLFCFIHWSVTKISIQDNERLPSFIVHAQICTSFLKVDSAVPCELCEPLVNT